MMVKQISERLKIMWNELHKMNLNENDRKVDGIKAKEKVNDELDRTKQERHLW